MPADDGDEKRHKTREFFQELGPADHEGPAVLTGWVAVCEWMDEDGDRFLSMGHDHAIARWHAEGMLHSGLYQWPDPPDDA